MKTYPLLIDLKDRLAAVVGGGPVAFRKAVGFSEAGAQVRLICPESLNVERAVERFRRAERPVETVDGHDQALEDSYRISQRIAPIAEPYRPEHLDGVFLVAAAATPEVNARVVADAKSRGLLVNSADAPETGDFLAPAVLRRGDLCIAVSTGGRAPAVAKRIRIMLEQQFDESWADWLEIYGEIRQLVLAAVADPQARRHALEALADLDWLRRYRSEGRESAVAAMRQVVDDARGR